MLKLAYERKPYVLVPFSLSLDELISLILAQNVDWCQSAYASELLCMKLYKKSLGRQATVSDHEYDVKNLTVGQLLREWGSILDELRRRDIVRNSNNPVSDYYAELLFCKALGWEREDSNATAYDAKDSQGKRYQIKARRLTQSSRQMGAIRNLDSTPPPFDALAGLLVAGDFKVIRAVIVPVSIVLQRSKFVKYTNSWRFLLHDEVWTLPDVQDVTSEVRDAAAAYG